MIKCVVYRGRYDFFHQQDTLKECRYDWKKPNGAASPGILRLPYFKY